MKQVTKWRRELQISETRELLKIEGEKMHIAASQHYFPLIGAKDAWRNSSVLV